MSNNKPDLVKTMLLMLICTGNIYTLKRLYISLFLAQLFLNAFAYVMKINIFCEILLLKISHFSKLYFNGYT